MNDVKRKLLIKETISKWCGTCAEDCESAIVARGLYTLRFRSPEVVLMYVKGQAVTSLDVSDLEHFCGAYKKEKEA